MIEGDLFDRFFPLFDFGVCHRSSTTQRRQTKLMRAVVNMFKAFPAYIKTTEGDVIATASTISTKTWFLCARVTRSHLYIIVLFSPGKMANCEVALSLTCFNDTSEDFSRISTYGSLQNCHGIAGTQGLDRYLRGHLLAVIGVVGKR